MINGGAGRAFMREWGMMQSHVHRTACDRGWWDEQRSIGTLIALLHSELSEALEAARCGNQPDDHIPEYSGLEAEMADVVIRIMDLAQAEGLDVAGAIIAKARYNDGRAFKHGGKEF